MIFICYILWLAACITVNMGLAILLFVAGMDVSPWYFLGFFFLPGLLSNSVDLAAEHLSYLERKKK